MNRQELEQRILEARKDGYSKQEILKVLKQEGVQEQQIRQMFQEIERRRSREEAGTRQESKVKKSRGSAENTIPGIDLSSDSYKLKQKLLSLSNSYHVYDGEEMVLKAHQKLLKLKERIKFSTPDGEEVFRAQAQQITDAAGDYELIEPESEKPLLNLQKKFSLAVHQWKIRSVDGSERKLCEIKSENPMIAWLRVIGGIIPFFPNVLVIIPHSYTIEDPEGNRIGEIEGKLSIRDTYEIKVGSTGEVPRESVVAAAVAIDALEGN